VDERAAAFARLFLAVHEGVYIGTIGPDGTSTIAANPHVKLILGYGGETPDAEVRPFDPEHFHDAQSRAAVIERLTNDGSLINYLVRLRRADQQSVWVEITARAEQATGGLRVEALVRTRSDRIRCRPRTEQPARDDPHVGRAPFPEDHTRARCTARAGDHPQ
jgi:PAS domain-containing protein